MLEGALGALRAAQASCLSVPVLYRGAGGEGMAMAVPGRTVFHTRGDHGTWARTETRDFIVAAGQLGAPPAAGDEIVFQGRTYEVLAPNGEPVWRWSDPWCTAMRIHTKLTGGGDE